MLKEYIYKTAMEQSAIDLSCSVGDFLGEKNKVVLSKANERARRYLKLPHICSIVSYGSCAVASVGEVAYLDLVQSYLDKFPVYHLFETPNIHYLERLFEPYRAKVCFMAEYFLPEGETAVPETPYELRCLLQEDFHDLYRPEWSNALSFSRPELDVLGVGAYKGGQLVALAACSADCDDMWQIGVDVLPEYRGQRLATAVTSRLNNEIIQRGKVPFYCAAWSNIRSVRNALASGFKPAWVEIAVKENEYVESFIR